MECSPSGQDSRKVCCRDGQVGGRVEVGQEKHNGALESKMLNTELRNVVAAPTFMYFYVSVCIPHNRYVLSWFLSYLKSR